MRTFRCGMTFMTNMIQIWQQIWQIWTTNMTENTKKSPKTTKITTNHHQHPPTNQHVPPIWFLVTICINYYLRRKCLSAPQLWCGLEIIRTTVVVRIRNYPHPSNISGLVWFGFGEPLNFQTSNITGEAWAQYIELFQIFSCLARNSLTECLCFGENFSLGRFRAPQTQNNMTGGGRGGVGEFQFGKV